MGLLVGGNVCFGNGTGVLSGGVAGANQAPLGHLLTHASMIGDLAGGAYRSICRGRAAWERLSFWWSLSACLSGWIAAVAAKSGRLMRSLKDPAKPRRRGC